MKHVETVSHQEWWLSATVVEEDGQLVLTVSRTVQLRESDVRYGPVSSYLAAHCHQAAETQRADHDRMILREAYVQRFRVYELCPGAHVEHTCSQAIALVA